MHLIWNISAGQLSILLAIIGLFLRINQVATIVTMLTVEHEMLLQDYAQQRDIKVDELATRRALKRPKILGIF